MAESVRAFADRKAAGVALARAMRRIKLQPPVVVL
jgi:predicted phosphoribosyltransferase